MADSCTLLCSGSYSIVNLQFDVDAEAAVELVMVVEHQHGF